MSDSLLNLLEILDEVVAEQESGGGAPTEDQLWNIVSKGLADYLDNRFPINRDELVTKLSKKNIETRNAFVPINKQKILINKYNLFSENECPNANYIMDNGIYLPSGNTITNEEIDFVCDIIRKISKSS